MSLTTSNQLHVVFDFDGTLVDWRYDTTPLVIDLFREKLGSEFTDKHLEKLSTTQGYAASVKAYFDRDQQPSINNEIADITCDQVRSAAKIPENINLVLEQLSTRYKLHIFSARDPISLKYAIENMGIKEYFESVTGYEGMYAPKPDAQGFLSFIKTQNLTIDRVLYIGDKFPDMHMASEAGVRFIGAGWLRDSLINSECTLCTELIRLPLVVNEIDSQTAPMSPQ